jgi:hypothetical protein
MSAKFSSLRKRLDKLEQEQADRARREELADCNCPELKSWPGFHIAIYPKVLESDLHEMCPVHGLRRFGPITIFDFEDAETTAKLEQLIDAHELLLSQYSQSNGENEENES